MMPLLNCREVDYGWNDTATPDDVTVEVQLERTIHEFYPSLQELILFYDSIKYNRNTEFIIGTGDHISIAFPEGADDLVTVDLPPVRFTVERAELLGSLRSLLADVFKNKSQMSSCEERQTGLANIQTYLDDHGGETNVSILYQDIVNSQ